MSRNATNIQRKAIAIKEKFIHFSAIFKEYSNIAKGINTALSINLYDFIKIEKELPCFQNNKVKNKKLVLVFDDLERSRIDLVNLLGAINHYTEDCGIKTIIIADEEKIFSCDNCGLCAKKCPAGAITADGFDPKKCSDYMKNAFQHIGRGAVCGVCIKSCMKKA